MAPHLLSLFWPMAKNQNYHLMATRSFGHMNRIFFSIMHTRFGGKHLLLRTLTDTKCLPN